ncbi:hypothetical protein PG985_010490 [Apiospora marii]|uniref:Uncharacterized protein n=1 Tax=Apiospora marii TaxID=335849 RepID=A0ABR1RZI6_9PEZI
MIHVGCACLMFVFWFQKPLDIASTESIDIRGFQDQINLLLLEYHVWKEIDTENLRIAPVGSHLLPRCETESNRYFGGNDSSDRLLAQARSADHDLEFATTADIETSFAQLENYVPDYSKFLPCGLRFTDRNNSRTGLSIAEYMALVGAVKEYWLLDSTVSPRPETYRPKLIGRHVGPDLGFLAAHNPIKAQAPFKRQSNVMTHWERTQHGGLREAWSALSERKITLFIIIPFSIIYGGLHCTAWGFHFPSQQEEFMWKLSAILVSGFLVVVILAVLLVAVFALIVSIPQCWGGKDYFEDVDQVVFWPLFAAMAICFAATRTFLVVECFISLRSLPVGAYIMPEWLQMIPHL